MAVSSGNPLSGDVRSLQQLRASAATDPKATVRAAAKQLEGIFMQQLMKSMRDASVSTGMLDNAGTKMGNEMLDAQFATQMTGRPGGLSDVIARQLDRQLGQPLANIASDVAATAAKPAAAESDSKPATAEPAPAGQGRGRRP